MQGEARNLYRGHGGLYMKYASSLDINHTIFPLLLAECSLFVITSARNLYRQPHPTIGDKHEQHVKPYLESHPKSQRS